VNLHAIVAPVVAAVNPMATATWKQSSGATVNVDYSRTSTYVTVNGVQVQMQALTYKDLMMLDGIAMNGEARALYVNGNIEGVSRPEARGGDLFTLADSSIWLVVHVLENWSATSGWTKVAVVRQTS
jgi:hypothetical protein